MEVAGTGKLRPPRSGVAYVIGWWPRAGGGEWGDWGKALVFGFPG